MVDFEVKVSSIEEYLSKVFESSSNLKKNSIHNEVLYYRGHEDDSYCIEPSIARNRKFTCDISILDEERNLIEMAKYRLPNLFRNDLLPIDMMALLQHHGIPTRLLDITSNPLVALYFAICGYEKSNNTDGEVIFFINDEASIANYPVVNAIADSYKFAFTTFEYLSSFYEKVKEQPYFIEQKYDLQSCYDSNSGGRWIEVCCKKPIFVYAQEQSERQKLQHGKYILFPNEIEGGEKPHFNKIISPIEKNEDSIHRRIIIPKEYKQNIAERLEILGISASTLFSDNIDIVCSSIAANAHKRSNFKENMYLD